MMVFKTDDPEQYARLWLYVILIGITLYVLLVFAFTS
jgi:hypothetical protein